MTALERSGDTEHTDIHSSAVSADDEDLFLSEASLLL